MIIHIKCLFAQFSVFYLLFFFIICNIFFSPLCDSISIYHIFFFFVIPPQWLVLPPLDGNTHVYNKSFFVDVYYLFKNAWSVIREINNNSFF